MSQDQLLRRNPILIRTFKGKYNVRFMIKTKLNHYEYIAFFLYWMYISFLFVIQKSLKKYEMLPFELTDFPNFCEFRVSKIFVLTLLLNSQQLL